MQTPQGVHWGPALARVLEGRYCFRLNQLPLGTAGLRKTFILDWDRSVDSEGIAAIPDLTPGVYSLEKGDPESNDRCRTDPDVLPAWVVIVPKADFSHAAAEWKDQSGWLNQLEQSGAGRSTILTVRHAILAGLAESAQRK